MCVEGEGGSVAYGGCGGKRTARLIERTGCIDGGWVVAYERVPLHLKMRVHSGRAVA